MVDDADVEPPGAGTVRCRIDARGCAEFADLQRSPRLPGPVATRLASAWERPWKRRYIRSCLRLIGIKLR